MKAAGIVLKIKKAWHKDMGYMMSESYQDESEEGLDSQLPEIHYRDKESRAPVVMSLI